ncbi:MAG TPA: SGNH/GDSL hydrolase family protein [Allocoleopsis sp.]
MNVGLVSVVVLVGSCLLLEVGLRLLFGFGNPLLYLADAEIGYLLAPNQRTRRFGNRIAINEYSMRSSTITNTRPTSTLRVLLLGDSVANGASWTDQNRTISALMTTQLELAVRVASDESSIGHKPFERVEVLNASANSWGPRNELGYLKRFGSFEAQAIVLLLNTDDLFAAAPTSDPVGRAPNYPNRKPPYALAEVYTRYLSPRLSRLRMKTLTKKLAGLRDEQRRKFASMPPLSPCSSENTQSGSSDRHSCQGASYANGAPTLAPELPEPRSGLAQQETEAFHSDSLAFNLDAIRQIQALAAHAGAEFVLAMTPLWREIAEPGACNYELKARDRLTKLTQDEPIRYLDFLPMFNRVETPQKLYRDHIHLSPEGNQRVSEAIARSLVPLLHLSATSTNGEKGMDHL